MELPNELVVLLLLLLPPRAFMMLLLVLQALLPLPPLMLVLQNPAEDMMSVLCRCR